VEEEETKDKPRYWEVDTARGVLIFLMIIYHFFYNLVVLGAYDLPLFSKPVQIARVAGEVGFIFIVGVSLSLSRYRKRGDRGFKGYLVRGLGLLGIGLIITVISFFVAPEHPIYFGILHCIGICIVLAYPFLRLRFANFVLGTILCVLGIFLFTIRVDTYLLILFGLRPDPFLTADYFPLLPWFGVVLLGMFVGDLLYSENERYFDFPDLSKTIPIRITNFAGRYALIIYLVHQPVLIGILYMLGIISLDSF